MRRNVRHRRYLHRHRNRLLDGTAASGWADGRRDRCHHSDG
jgi:hypothetical protein